PFGGVGAHGALVQHPLRACVDDAVFGGGVVVQRVALLHVDRVYGVVTRAGAAPDAQPGLALAVADVALFGLEPGQFAHYHEVRIHHPPDVGGVFAGEDDVVVAQAAQFAA